MPTLYWVLPMSTEFFEEICYAFDSSLEREARCWLFYWKEWRFRDMFRPALLLPLCRLPSSWFIFIGVVALDPA